MPKIGKGGGIVRQRASGTAPGDAAVGQAFENDPAAPQRERRAHTREPHGQARRLLGPDRHHGRP